MVPMALSQLSHRACTFKRSSSTLGCNDLIYANELISWWSNQISYLSHQGIKRYQWTLINLEVLQDFLDKISPKETYSCHPRRWNDSNQEIQWNGTYGPHAPSTKSENNVSRSISEAGKRRQTLSITSKIYFTKTRKRPKIFCLLNFDLVKDRIHSDKDNIPHIIPQLKISYKSHYYIKIVPELLYPTIFKTVPVVGGKFLV